VRRAALSAGGIVLLLLTSAAPGLAAEQTSPDTVLGGYLRTLSDSTDRYFGASSAPLDTVGLDSVLSFRLAHPDPMRDLRRPRTSLAPWLSFNRADGPLYGGVLTLGRLSGMGALSGRMGYAVGPNDLLGGAAYRKRWGGRLRSSPTLILEGQVGRFTTVLDPDRQISWQRVLRALLNASDRHHYYRRDGARMMVERESGSWRASLGLRDQLESPLSTTTTWNLMKSTPALEANVPAAAGRVREIQLEAATRLPGWPWQGEISFRHADRDLGSDFDYQRLHLTVGGDLALGRVATLVPQVDYGRLMGDAIPQASFFLGGTHSLRSLKTNELGGTRKAFGRLDVVFTPDLLKLSPLPHPGLGPLQTGLFAATGAVWGPSPFGDPPISGGEWPEPQAWLSEIGASLLYRPGLPEPRGFVRLDYARGVGPNPESRITVHYSVPLDLLRPLH
jgi:hypothetical protein